MLQFTIDPSSLSFFIFSQSLAWPYYEVFYLNYCCFFIEACQLTPLHYIIYRIPRNKHPRRFVNWYKKLLVFTVVLHTFLLIASNWQ